MPWIMSRLAWKVGCGHNVYIETDAIVGCNNADRLIPRLKYHLEERGITKIHHICTVGGKSLLGSHWYCAQDLALNDIWRLEWEQYIQSLNCAGIRLRPIEDSLVWSW